MWQEIIIGIIAIAALLYVGRRLYRMVKRPKGMGCGCGCEGCRGCSIVEGNLNKHFPNS